MAGSIVRISDRQHRIQSVGRAKVGVYDSTGKGRPRSIKTWRLCSSREDLLEQLAEEYGGKVERSTHAKASHSHEVITETDTLNVVLPPDPLGNSPMYRKYGGKGLERECDGEICHLSEPRGNQIFESDVPCICETKGFECKVNTRLEVLISSVAMAGTWTFVTNSEQNADTIPAMVQAIESAATRGFPLATLTVEEAQARGGSKKFILVRLAPVVSLQELMSGGGTLTAGALQQAAAPPVGELGQGEPLGSRPVIEPDGPLDEVLSDAVEPDPEDAMSLPAIMARVKAYAPMKESVMKMWVDSKIPPLTEIPEDRVEAITQMIIDEIGRSADVICGTCGYSGLVQGGPSACLVCGDEAQY